MQVNQPRISVPSQSLSTSQKQPISNPQPPVSVSPSDSPPQTKPPEKPPETVPLGSSQEGQQIQSQLSSTSPETIQTEVQTLEKTEKFKKGEESIFGEVRVEQPDKKLLDKVVRKTQQTVPPEMLGQPPQDPSTLPPGQQPSDQVGVGGILIPTANGVVARFRLSDQNIANTGLTAVLSGGFAVINQENHLEDGRVLLVRARQVDVNVGVKLKGVEEALPVGGSLNIGVEGSSDVAYARKLKDGESLIQVRETDPPSKKDIQRDPVGSLAPGDEIAYRGMLKVSVKAGVVEPHSHVKFSVGGSVENEFITSIRRMEGDPPKFLLHVEPGNRKIDVNASVGWGPFAVTGGGGFASTVHYQFEMTPEALSKFMKDGKLPKVPDPNKYLRSLDSLSQRKQEKLLEAFKQESNGVKLVTFGATKSMEGYIEASATVAKAKTSSTRMEAIYIRNGDILHEDIHTMMASHSAWFHGELRTSLSLNQANRFSLVEGQEPVKTYLGLEAGFKVADTKTSESDLRKRIEQANALLGPVKDSSGQMGDALVLPSRSDGSWGESSLSLKANITPDILGKLEELGSELIARESQPTTISGTRSVTATIDHLKHEHGISRTELKSLLKDLRAISEKPELQGNQEEIRREQGVRVAAFLASGKTSHVGDEELKRLAALQRLLGPDVKLVELKFSSDIHTRRIDGLAIEGFLAPERMDQLSEMTHTLPTSSDGLQDLKSRITGDPWDRFNVGAQKLKALQQIRQDLVADTTLEPQEKTNLLKKVDEFLDGLDAAITRQLDTPNGRQAVVRGLMAAGPILPSELKRIYSSPEKMYQDPTVRSEFLDMVILTALRDMSPGNTSEVAQLVKEIAGVDKGVIGMEHAFKLLSSVKEFGPEMQADVIRQIGVKTFASLVPRMTDDQKWSLYYEIIPAGFPNQPKALETIESAIISASKTGDKRFKELDGRLDDLEKEIGKLGDKQGKLLDRTSGTEPLSKSKSEDLLELVKNNYKDADIPLESLKEKIADDFVVLGGVRHQQLVSRTEQLTQQVETLIGGIDRMEINQRKALFTEVLKQDIMGDVSQLILQRLIGSSQDQGELVGFAKDMHDKIRKSNTTTGDKLSSPFRNYTKSETREGLQQRLLEIQLMLG